MRQQSYLVRKGARYHFRRRIPHSPTAHAISISLGTADPSKARCLARRLGYIKRDPEEFIPEGAYDQWMTRGFPAIGDVLFTTEAPLANVAELDTSDKVVIGQRLITFKTDPEKILPRFLKWSLISPQMQSDIHAQATGATVLGIKAKLLKKIRFYVPNELAVQEKIASACEEAFERRNRLISLYNGKLVDLATLRQTLLQKAFAGELT